MRLRSDAARHVTHRRASTSTVDFAAGEEMRTEISAKFRREGVEAELAAAGLDLERWWTDPRRRLRPLPFHHSLVHASPRFARRPRSVPGV